MPHPCFLSLGKKQRAHRIQEAPCHVGERERPCSKEAGPQAGEAQQVDLDGDLVEQQVAEHHEGVDAMLSRGTDTEQGFSTRPKFGTKNPAGDGQAARAVATDGVWIQGLGIGFTHCITEMVILLMVVENDPKLLFCMPNTTKCLSMGRAKHAQVDPIHFSNDSGSAPQ
jgi:hypothetical protein